MSGQHNEWRTWRTLANIVRGCSREHGEHTSLEVFALFATLVRGRKKIVDPAPPHLRLEVAAIIISNWQSRS